MRVKKVITSIGCGRGHKCAWRRCTTGEDVIREGQSFPWWNYDRVHMIDVVEGKGDKTEWLLDCLRNDQMIWSDRTVLEYEFCVGKDKAEEVGGHLLWKRSPHWVIVQWRRRRIRNKQYFYITNPVVKKPMQNCFCQNFVIFHSFIIHSLRRFI